MKTLTLEMLRKYGACEEQRDRFQDFFGESVEVSEELALKHCMDFDFYWAAHEMLGGEKAEVIRGEARKRSTERAVALQAARKEFAEAADAGVAQTELEALADTCSTLKRTRDNHIYEQQAVLFAQAFLEAQEGDLMQPPELKEDEDVDCDEEAQQEEEDAHEDVLYEQDAPPPQDD